MDRDMNLPLHNHDHQHCIDDALDVAKTLCQQRGVKLTQQREQVLKLVWQSHKPLGAYALMEMLADAITKPVAPPTVYRALEFLSEQGLIHKIHSLNAFVGCATPNQAHHSHFLICRDCHVAIECGDNELIHSIDSIANQFDFTVDHQSLEVMGLCSDCQS
ncbi:MAG: Fur family transcriptional regulator [Cellvibrionaceae bacterium]